MIPNPIHKVLSTLSCHAVRHLLMGGQACVFYGAAEFSRDCDIAIIVNDENLSRLRMALSDLNADCIAVPPFEPDYLLRGHAVHFRCQHLDAVGIRLDVLSKMRGCEPFEMLWQRRLTLQDAAGTTFEILGIEDLVQSKKTQRDKDWPMIRRLVDAHYEQFKGSASEDQIRFWLRESRTPEALLALASEHPDLLRQVVSARPLLQEALTGNRTAIEQGLQEEEARERAADVDYWRPLKTELESLRRDRSHNPET